jgi:pyruvate ferredoxin oxidoreductase beta subunit
MPSTLSAPSGLNRDALFAAKADPVAEAKRLLALCAAMPTGVNLLVAEPPLAVNLAELSPERFAAKVTPARMHVATSVIEFLTLARAEIRRGDYFIEDLMGRVEAAPAFAAFRDAQFDALKALVAKGAQVSDLPGDAATFQTQLVALSQGLDVALEYLLGNLEKSVRLLERIGARATLLNLSGLFHNWHSGFYPLDPTGDVSTSPADLQKLAGWLRERGAVMQVFDKGNLRRDIADLDAAALAQVLDDADHLYEVEAGTFAGFAAVLLASEERRIKHAGAFSVLDLLACFKFAAGDRDKVSVPPVTRDHDPREWVHTDLGRALAALRENLSWVAVSAGEKAAGDLAAMATEKALAVSLGDMHRLAAKSNVTLASGRGGRRAENKLADLAEADLRFDLYCVAVLEKQPLAAVVKAAVNLLELTSSLENPDMVVSLDGLLHDRMAGHSYAAMLDAQGLLIRNNPMMAALEELRTQKTKVQLTIDVGGRAKPLAEASLEDFRRSVIQLGRRLRPQQVPERVLALIVDKVVPEIRNLPPQVIEPGAHDLEHIVELALAGVPARYPLRRKWDKINIDHFISCGHNLEPGIRNCLGCPVNSLYGLVTKTALAQGFNDIITYEATGCFEVYSGIWPYTGKKFPSVHGVFGGAPSEMLGGLAAKRARVRFAEKHGQPLPSERTLHLGWGGDGGTFDIGFGNLSGLFSRLQKIGGDELEPAKLMQRAMYVCYDNEGYQNTGNQYSAASAPGGNTTTNPQGKDRPFGNELRKKPIVEIVADHGVPIAARMNIHRQEHITRVIARALADGTRGSFIHFLQPCTTGWKFTGDSLTYDLAALSEEGGLFTPVTIEHGVAYLEHYPTPRNPSEAFLKMQARFKHLLGSGPQSKAYIRRVMDYYREEWMRNLRLTGFEGEISQADRLGYLDTEHRIPRTQ